MKESIGSTASLNIVFAFIAIVFAFLAASLSYYKAFKVNNIITNSIEKFEGINDYSINEINTKLDSIGYQRYSGDCPSTRSFNGKTFALVESEKLRGLCFYIYKDNLSKYYEYGITTYMTINLPIVSDFIKIPVNTVSKNMYGCYGLNYSFSEFCS